MPCWGGLFSKISWGKNFEIFEAKANASIVLRVEPLGASVALVAALDAYYYQPMTLTFV